MENRAVLRVNVHEDESRTFDVLLSDGPDGDNNLEVNCLSEKHARELLSTLGMNGFSIQAEFCNRYDS